MSMPPVFMGSGDTMKVDDAVNNVLISVAMQESAIAHILNAEGEILQAIAAEEDCAGFKEIVTSLPSMIIDLQALECRIVRKLEIAASASNCPTS